MCGIAGMLWFDPARPVSPGLVARMGEVLAHRGPDDQGLHVAGPVGLAHRRLRIIDLSAEGRQPLANEDGSLWIVFNGEIYNFRALRPELERRGHRFRSRTDTEVILHLYEERGAECLEALQGMFALAIWDGRRRELLLARDRLGKKPLAYWADGQGIRFASEAKAILQDPALPVRPDPAGIVRYLTYGYLPGAASAFQGIRQLPPAHYLRCREGRVTLHRYWQLPTPAPAARPAEAWQEDIRARLAEAVRARLLSDVPLGAFLSGGIDSSAVVAMMARAGAGRVQTFCAGFPEQEYDERAHARLVAERLGTEHHELTVEPDAAAVLPTLAWHFDEPFGDSSAIPTYYVARLTRQHVTVALGGDGGDELFGGYERYLAAALAGRLDRLPAAGLLRAAAAALGRLLPRPVDRQSWLRRAARFLEGAGEPPERRYARWLCQLHGEARRELCTPELLTAAGGDPLLPLLTAAGAASGGSAWERAQAVDLALYLPDDLLRKVDIASMASGLEVRSPFLDHTLVEFAATIPGDLKLGGRTTKRLLRAALAGLLPDPVLTRRKMGFGVPIDHWLRGELRELAADALLSPRALGRGYLQPAAVRRLLEEHAAGRADWRDRLWTLLMLELWHRTFLDGDGRLAGQRRETAGKLGG